MGAPQLKEALKYKMTVTKGSLAGQNLVFQQMVVKIGRGTDNDVILSDDLRASRYHAEIRWDGFELKIINLSKKNYIGVNGSQLQEAKLDSGTHLIVGDSEFVIEFDQESKTQIHYTENAEPAPAPPPYSATPILVPQDNAISVKVQSTPLQQVHQQAAAPAAPIHPIPPIPGMTGGGIATPQPRRRPKTRSANPAGGNRVIFYVLVAVLGFGFYWLMTSGSAKKKELTFRSTEQIEKDIEASREEIKEFEARKEKLDTVQFRRAQENYIRGFRDYKQGNYGRARESFQVVLNLDPDNDLAKRYYHLSKVKFDEMVKFHMLQGNRYREKKNWRMCKSSYFNVMTMLNNGQDPTYKEAKQYYDQCSLAEEGRF